MRAPLSGGRPRQSKAEGKRRERERRHEPSFRSFHRAALHMGGRTIAQQRSVSFAALFSVAVGARVCPKERRRSRKENFHALPLSLSPSLLLSFRPLCVDRSHLALKGHTYNAPDEAERQSVLDRLCRRARLLSLPSLLTSFLLFLSPLPPRVALSFAFPYNAHNVHSAPSALPFKTSSPFALSNTSPPLPSPTLRAAAQSSPTQSTSGRPRAAGGPTRTTGRATRWPPLPPWPPSPCRSSCSPTSASARSSATPRPPPPRAHITDAPVRLGREGKGREA